MKRIAFILLLGLSVLAQAADTVLVVSIDALHPDALSAQTSPTLFNDAREAGYRTAYYYSKPKLGYLNYVELR